MNTIQANIQAGALLALLLILPLSGCGDQDEPARAIEPPAGETHAEGDARGDAHEEGESGLVRFTADQLRQAKVEVGVVDSRAVSSGLTAPARIVPSETGIAHVGSLVAGRVVRFLVSEGAAVKKGTPLADIESLEIGELKGDYLRARAAVEQTRSALARQEQLLKENIGAQRSAEEARAAARTAVADLTAISTKLAALGIMAASLDGATGEALSARVVVRSPIAGVVSRREVALGEYVEPSRDIIDVVDPGAVYADAQVSPELAGGLRAGGVARVRTPDGQATAGRITFVAPQVDPESRTVQVRIALQGGRILRPEAFVTAEFDVPTTGGVILPVVPLTAVDRDASGAYVYAERQPGTFERVQVDLGEVTSEDAVVRAGVKPGDRIAVKGVFYLKSAQRKGELSEHEH